MLDDDRSLDSEGVHQSRGDDGDETRPRVDETRSRASEHPLTWRRGPRQRSVLELLQELESLTAELASHDPADLDGHAGAEASIRAHRAIDRIRAVQLGWLAAVESDGAWFGTGARSIVAWAARAHDVPFSEARGWVKTARTWRETLPTTAAAARAGAISTLKGTLISKTATTPARIEALTTAPSVGATGPDTDGTGTGDDAPASPDGASDGPLSTTAPPRTGEATLIGLASGYEVAAFAKIARRFAHVTDPEADERGYREALAREHFDLAATTGGYHLSGFLTFDHGQAVKTAMRAVTGVPAAGDTRTAGQRRAAALTGMSRLLLDKGLAGNVGTVRPHLSVHVSQTELDHLMHAGGPCGPPPPELARSTTAATAAGPERALPGSPMTSPSAREASPASPEAAPPGSPVPEPSTREASSRPALESLLTSPPAEWEDGTSPIPGAVLRRLASDCQVTRVVFGAKSEVLDVGRAQRTFTGHLRRAVVARDRHCVIDGCAAPPSLGQIHHVNTRWADGGATSIDNAALVCTFHNQWLEDHQVPLRRVVDENGVAHWQMGTAGSYRPRGGGRFPQDDPHHPDHVPRDDRSPPPNSG